jgi:chemotaxis protein MotB
MARKKRQEEHVNHEAWAIPYGDLITLLLAFFVVMYAISSVNEGKYRVLSESLMAAFRGKPKTTRPIQIGDNQPTGEADEGSRNTPPIGITDPRTLVLPRPEGLPNEGSDAISQARAIEAGLQRMADEVREALGGLIQSGSVRVRESDFWLEVEVETDILFPVGVAELSETAGRKLARLAEVLQPFPNLIRVEGHTDNVPISTRRFPSNWELSAARAASVVRLFQQGGVAPERLGAIGMGEYHPVADNDTPEGRNRNRRVVVVILSAERQSEALSELERTGTAEADTASDSGTAAPAATGRSDAVPSASSADGESSGGVATKEAD